MHAQRLATAGGVAPRERADMLRAFVVTVEPFTV
jgi:hypothetical protein